MRLIDADKVMEEYSALMRSCKMHEKAIASGMHRISLMSEALLREDLALKKQIPRRPLKAINNNPVSVCTCPECCYTVGAGGVGFDYCPNCGQRLEWEENDEHD